MRRWESARWAPPQPVKMQFTVHELACIDLVLESTKGWVSDDLKTQLGPAWRAQAAIQANLHKAGYTQDEHGNWGRFLNATHGH